MTAEQARESLRPAAALQRRMAGSTPRWRSLVRWCWLVYLTILVAVAVWLGLDPDRWDLIRWQPQDAIWIVAVSTQIGAQLTIEIVLFGILGFLTGAAIGPAPGKTRWPRCLLACALATLVAAAIAIALQTAARGAPPLIPSFLVIIVLGLTCCWGSWLGATWIGARSNLGWLGTQLVVSVVAILVGGSVLVWTSLASEPLAINSRPVTTADRRRLVQLIKAHDPRRIRDDKTTRLTLAEEDLNQLTSWGLSLLPGEHHAQLGLKQDEIKAHLTYQVPFLPKGRRNLNLIVSGQPITRDGEVGFAPSELRLGQLVVPTQLLAVAGPVIIGEAWQNEQSEPFFQSLQAVDVQPNAVVVSYRRLDVNRGFVRDALIGLGMLEDLEPSTVAQVKHLIEVAEQSPELTFKDCFEAAFREAREQSKSGKAIKENQAAILALGYLVGHQRLGALLGNQIPRPSPEASRRFAAVKLRNRRDWAQHYTISAALQVLGNTAASLDVGVLKEELDADGGSGFSFADLLADRAGTKLAVEATKSETAAAELRSRIIAGFVVDDFMPDGSDLPEGLTDQQLNDEFGGVGGEEFQRLLQQIDRRVETAPGFSNIRGQQ